MGNKTAARLANAKVFGKKRWLEFSPEDREQIVEDALSIVDDAALARRGMRVWGLDEQAAENFGGLVLEQGYSRHCRQAWARLLPHLEEGLPYANAKIEAYGEPPPVDPMPALPFVADELTGLTNPVVSRALSELRRVVNAIVREYGKPEMIRVELARDLKKSRKHRQDITKKNRDNEKARQEAAREILKETGDHNPSRRDMEKFILYEECNRECPYTGDSISMTALFGPVPQFDVEHIIPFSRCLDNSFMNKTLCRNDENRKKGNRSPFEAYGSNPRKWPEILERVNKFKGSAARAKMRRFRLENVADLDDFTSRQLNDTRYASRQAVKYLGLLYGKESKTRVQAGQGGITVFLRGAWGLNKILNDGGLKTRDDHRHHAVDAVAIALTDPGVVNMLSRAAADAPRQRRRLFAPVEPPWPGFPEETRQAVLKTVVSHRVSRKVKGPLHEETFYTGLKKDQKGNEFHHVRKALKSMTEEQAKRIVDNKVRELVLKKLAESGGNPKIFNDEANLPCLKTGNGDKITIRKARIRMNISPFTVGRGDRQRHVLTKENHHMEIVETVDRKGKPAWEGHLVSLFEAHRRLKSGEPVIKRGHGPDKRFVFSLAKGEIIELDTENGGRDLFVIRSVQLSNSYKRITYVSITDARKKEKIIKAKKFHTSPVTELRKLGCRKVTIGPLGEVRWAND